MLGVGDVNLLSVTHQGAGAQPCYHGCNPLVVLSALSLPSLLLILTFGSRLCTLNNVFFVNYIQYTRLNQMLFFWEMLEGIRGMWG